MNKTKLFLSNTLSGQKEKFVPINIEKGIGMYVCGPTVYDRIHIGNARTFITFDILYRTLCLIYGKEKIKYIRNITDIDDKINKRAAEKNISIKQLTNETIKMFYNDISYLNILNPTAEPKATEEIESIIKFIKYLLEKGFAYKAKDHILFDTKKIKKYPILSKAKQEDLKKGARIENHDYKNSHNDFVLWKPAKQNEESYKSPWGDGRPGWHIECSAMSHKHLGESFDIHGGGQDLIFPHHDNEIAQNHAAFCEKQMAKYWVHNGMVTKDGKKMSKSEGNFIHLSDIIDTLDGEVIRYIFLFSHYKEPLEWSDKGVEQAKKGIERFYTALKKGEEIIKDKTQYDNVIVREDFYRALLNDLNTVECIKFMHETANEVFKGKTESAIELLKMGNILGILSKYPKDYFKKELDKNEIVKIESMIIDREEAKKNKDYQKADTIRKELLKMGITLEDTKTKTTWKIKS